ncbi:hypothetical protein N8782_04235 [Methylophilaceae bacterium]|nr:hypothetical protein [Methylophilaceae bacterium]
MRLDEKNFQTEEIPQKIQDILLNFGEKQKIGISEYLRTFNQCSLKSITEHMDETSLSEIKRYLDCYLIHSKNKKVIITSGQII